jgi:DNA-binding NtrC family response regulator
MPSRSSVQLTEHVDYFRWLVDQLPAFLSIIDSDLVLTDSAMPGMHGEDLAEEIVRAHPGLPVILMSGFAASGLAASGADAASAQRDAAGGAVAAFIQKPFLVRTLLDEVRRVLHEPREAR